MDNTYEMAPKYYVVKKKLIELINSEAFAETQMIPSERELMKQFNVSRITAKRAVDDLVNEGYLYRVQGKGTFLREEEAEHDLVSIMSCTEDIIKMGMTPTKALIKEEVIEADKTRQKRLHLANNEMVYMVKRVYYADKIPVNYTTTYLPIKYFPGIEEHDFSKESIYDVLENIYNVKITSAKRTLEAVLALDEVATLLDINQKQPVILFRAITYGIVNGREIPIETFKSYYRSDRFKFYINQNK
ncbi:GntR family transcriptional regulator [Proteiniclasticum sp. SCR006]|uniref:GntR family transcriptional regulator n=1 Tax=Proteiniclasticum aestuarii TaxID=2817862 RepID=A0A939HB53_9CLOT|nr:GntR family transcriptional regulator [Proteiniclasticum aestuarii]MBO1265090.1 GntR family transcriptional regulator [Proteiniclasticum aestuarii]